MQTMLAQTPRAATYVYGVPRTPVETECGEMDKDMLQVLQSRERKVLRTMSRMQVHKISEEKDSSYVQSMPDGKRTSQDMLSTIRNFESNCPQQKYFFIPIQYVYDNGFCTVKIGTGRWQKVNCPCSVKCTRKRKTPDNF